VLARHDSRAAYAIATEHAHIRSLLANAGLALARNGDGAARLEELAVYLARHAELEARVVYPWAAARLSRAALRGAIDRWHARRDLAPILARIGALPPPSRAPRERGGRGP
jgi:hypothetical protein